VLGKGAWQRIRDGAGNDQPRQDLRVSGRCCLRDFLRDFEKRVPPSPFKALILLGSENFGAGVRPSIPITRFLLGQRSPIDSGFSFVF